MTKTILKGRGFILRHIEIKDLQGYFECFQGENIVEYLLKIPKNLSEAKKELKIKISDFSMDKPFGECFAIEVNGKFAGYIELSHLNQKNREHQGEIGYCIHPDFRGKGLATNSVKLLTNYAFKKYKLKRLVAIGRVKNKASARVLEKADYKLEGIMRKNKCVNGRYLDDFLYAKII